MNDNRVDIVNVCEGRYWNYYVNGVFVPGSCGTHFSSDLAHPYVRAELAQTAGVALEDLRFTVYGTFCDQMNASVMDYNPNDYDSSVAFEHAVDAYTIAPDPHGRNLDFEQLAAIYRS